MSLTTPQVRALLDQGTKLPLATRNYPSRGQTAVQTLYQTRKGKFFLKKSSKQNHIDCQIQVSSGTLAEREYWAFCLAEKIGLKVPTLWLLDDSTTVQIWLNLPDAHVYGTTQGKMELVAEDVFNCSLFDWVTGQIDRHDANYLYDYVNERIILIDSAHSLLKYSGSIPDYLRYFEVGYPRELRSPRSTKISTSLTRLTQNELRRLLPLKQDDESTALELRFEQIKNVSTLHEVIRLYREAKR